jgi:serine kinase of HPr protein (carbohydrate metabolism regulator)
MSSGPIQTTIHATCVVLGEAGVLIRGSSGAGKSALADELLTSASGGFARLIGDDRIVVTTLAGRLIAAGHPAIAGLIERRGAGIVRRDPEPGCVVRLVVDLTGDPPPRMPAQGERQTRISGVDLPLVTLGPGPDRAARVRTALAGGRGV